jgi:hypothetical protein
MFNNKLRGISSLLFIIPTIKSFYCSNLISWKISNFILIIASFLCNVTNYHIIFLIFDYLSIYSVSLSYINNKYITILSILLLIYEYNKSNSIEIIKNVVLITAIIKSIIYTYLYVNKFYFYIHLISSIVSICLYKLRYFLYINNNNKYILLLTYLFHICITIILYVSSITATTIY